MGVQEILFGLLGVASVAGLVLLLVVRSKSTLLEVAGAEPLDTGTTLLLDGRSIRACSAAARNAFRCAPGENIDTVLKTYLGPGARDALDAVSSAETSGTNQQRLVRTESGQAFEVSVAPCGGLLSLAFHDASFVLSEVQPKSASMPGPLNGQTANIDAPDPASDAHGGDPDASAVPTDTVQRQSEPQDAIETLLGKGAIVLWHRTRDGDAIWGSGSITLSEGRIGANEVLEMLAARQLRAGRPEEARTAMPPLPMSARLEVVRGESVLPLSVVEAAGPDETVYGFAVDATATASAERTLGRFVQTMTETFAHLTVGLAIFDRNQTLALFNPAVVSMWQQDPAWLARRPGLREILDRLRSARRIPEMRDYHSWRDQLLSLFDDTERVDYEELWNLADGSTIRVLGRPHPHGSLALIFDDATERMRLERRNRRMDDLITSTMQNLHEGLAVFAPDGTLQFVNHAFHGLWGTADDLISVNMHAREVAALCARLALETDVWDRMVAFATGHNNRQPWSARLSLGSGRMLAARFATLPDGSTMALFSDMTDSERIAAILRERNEALEAAEQMRGAVLDQISHRLRTPLNTIVGFSELLASERDGHLDGFQSEYVSGILEAAAQLLDTITTVTDLASSQIDPMDGEEGDPSVEELLETTRALLESRANAQQITFAARPENAVGLTDCRPLRLRQIIFNLASDAIQRCPAGGEVLLTARRDDDGMFEIATRESLAVDPDVPRDGDTSPDSLVEQAGLAMSLVRRLVASEGGTISISRATDGTSIAVRCRFPDLSAREEDQPEGSGQDPTDGETTAG